jgi:putative Mn2+ efflux pump MntP
MATQVSVRRTIGWIGLCTTLVGMALYSTVRVGETHDYTTGRVVMILGCVILLSRYAFKK